jgi:HTH-type transcriptional regulator / antitoxin HigA
MEGMNMQNREFTGTERAWQQVQPFVFVAHTETEYKRLVTLMDELIDEIGENEAHPLASMLDVIGALIERYEDDHVPELT